jgi:hypothetical protein
MRSRLVEGRGSCFSALAFVKRSSPGLFECSAGVLVDMAQLSPSHSPIPVLATRVGGIPPSVFVSFWHSCVYTVPFWRSSNSNNLSLRCLSRLCLYRPWSISPIKQNGSVFKVLGNLFASASNVLESCNRKVKTRSVSNVQKIWIFFQSMFNVRKLFLTLWLNVNWNFSKFLTLNVIQNQTSFIFLVWFGWIISHPSISKIQKKLA